MTDCVENKQTVASKNSFFRNLKSYIGEYCYNTSIHGFRYFGERDRPHVERFLWFLVFALSFGACSYSIYNVYKRWEASPVIVNFANRGTPIYNIPFPAVTVCPELKFAKNVRDINEKLAEDYMSIICQNDFANETDFANESIYSFMYDMKPELKINSCYFTFEDVNCTDLFVPIITDVGICYSFNLLSSKEIFKDNISPFIPYDQSKFSVRDWSIETGYVEDAGMGTYPLRAYLAGAKHGLSLSITLLDNHLFSSCKSPFRGYRVTVDVPTTIPQPSKKYFRLPFNQSVMAVVDPVMITTSPSVKKYHPNKRGCYTPEERSLKYFRNYTSSNCRIECFTNYTLRFCGCAGYFMPRTNGTKICGSAQMGCIKDVLLIMHAYELKLKLENFQVVEPSDDFNPNCDCLQLCSDMSYTVDTSQTAFEWEEFLPPLNESNVSELKIFFNSETFITSQRNELYGITGLLANFGGLLGLFMGFSVLSFMEILYFLTIRIFYNKRLYGRWAASKHWPRQECIREDNEQICRR